MKISYLLPNSFKIYGWIMILISIISMIVGELDFLKDVKILAVYNSGFPLDGSNETEGFFKIIYDDIQFEISSVLAIIGGLFVAFARIKNEDEYISKLRMESLVWATWAHFILLMISIVTIFGMDFLAVVQFNMFTILLLFILRFHFELFKMRKNYRDEE